MHLVYIHQYFAFPTVRGGTRSYDLAREFKKLGIYVTVITTTTMIKGLNENKRWNTFEREGIIFWVLTSNYSQKQSFFKRIMLFLHFMFFSTIKILQIKCDLVLATSTPLSVGIPALIKKFISRTNYIFEVRDVWPEGPVKLGYIRNKVIIKILTWFEGLIYYNASHIVPLSTGMERIINERFNLHDKTTVITNISEINRFQNNIEYGSYLKSIDTEGKKIVLYAGALGRVNGINYLAKLALGTFDIDPDIIYLIFGVGNEKESIVEFCRDKGIMNKNIFFLDPVPKNQLPGIYSISSLGSSFVIDNKIMWENSANKFFDTLAAGKPILINHEGWQAELIKKENIGYVMPPELSKYATERFVTYINNNTLLELQGTNSLKLAKSKFSLEKATKLYMEVFEKSINNFKRVS